MNTEHNIQWMNGMLCELVSQPVLGLWAESLRVSIAHPLNFSLFATVLLRLFKDAISRSGVVYYLGVTQNYDTGYQIVFSSSHKTRILKEKLFTAKPWVRSLPSLYRGIACAHRSELSHVNRQDLTNYLVKKKQRST